jgi:murein DD-endopeptidase MepM/ murein hydrolase activator NlpD
MFAVVGCAAAAWCPVVLVACRTSSVAIPPPPPAIDIVLPLETEMCQGLVPPRATLDGLLRQLGVRPDLVPGIVSLARSVFDPRKLRTDQPYRLIRALDGSIRSFEYEIDIDRFLRIASGPNSPPSEMTASIVPYRMERGIVTLSGGISRMSPSLFEAMADAGEKPDLSVSLADVFSADIDFNSDLQPGDSFGVAFEKVYREGRFAAYGAVIAAEFRNEGRLLRAVRFTPPGGKPGYYDTEGRSLRKFFIASPLKFAPRVSSGFSRGRFHPILRIVRPHLGVDYLAPMGAPVIAVAAGVVVSAGWNGEGGRVVHLRHVNGYETLYMHLSSITVRAGQRVAQGDLIGRVGSTGMSTGPHLDYRVRRNGAYVNPVLEHRRMPPGEPIPALLMPQFAVERDRALARLVPVRDANGSAKGDRPPTTDK